jgi:hypothetical protein
MQPLESRGFRIFVKPSMNTKHPLKRGRNNCAIIMPCNYTARILRGFYVTFNINNKKTLCIGKEAIFLVNFVT